MKLKTRTFINRRITILYVVLLGIACFLIIRTLFEWSLFQKEEKALAIHLIEDVNKSDYKSLRMQGMNAASEDLNVSLFTHPLPPNSVEFMSILNAKPDAIIIGDYVHEQLDSFISEAQKQHIPVILSDYATEVDDVVYIGVDHRSAGRTAARYLSPLIEEKGNVAIIGYHEEGSSGFLIGKGADEELSSYSTINVKTNASCASDKNHCLSSLKQLLEQNKVDGIIALDAKSAYDVATLIKGMKLTKDIKMVAFEQSNSLIEYIQDETIDALFIYNSFNLGYLSLQYAEAMAKGDKGSSTEFLTTHIITKENMFWLQNQKLLFPMKNL